MVTNVAMSAFEVVSMFADFTDREKILAYLDLTGRLSAHVSDEDFVRMAKEAQRLVVCGRPEEATHAAR